MKKKKLFWSEGLCCRNCILRTSLKFIYATFCFPHNFSLSHKGPEHPEWVDQQRGLALTNSWKTDFDIEGLSCTIWILRTLKLISIVVRCRNYYIHIRQQKQKLGMMQLVEQVPILICSIMRMIRMMMMTMMTRIMIMMTQFFQQVHI